MLCTIGKSVLHDNKNEIHPVTEVSMGVYNN